MLKRRLTFAIKVAISVLLVWLLLDRIEVEPVFERWSVCPLVRSCSRRCCFSSRSCWRGSVGGACWPPLDTVLDYWPIMRIYFIGVFFNQTLPSTVGGDAFRVWLSSRLGVGLGKAVSGVLLDRLSGLLIILMVIVVTLPALFSLVPDTVARWSLVLVVGIGLAGYAVVLFVPRRLSPLSNAGGRPVPSSTSRATPGASSSRRGRPLAFLFYHFSCS